MASVRLLKLEWSCPLLTWSYIKMYLTVTDFKKILPGLRMWCILYISSPQSRSLQLPCKQNLMRIWFKWIYYLEINPICICWRLITSLIHSELWLYLFPLLHNEVRSKKSEKRTTKTKECPDQLPGCRHQVLCPCLSQASLKVALSCWIKP